MDDHVRGGMDRLNLGWWCLLGATLEQLSRVQPGDAFPPTYALLERAVPFVVAHHAARALVRLQVSEPAAVKLMVAIDQIKKVPERTEPITVEEASALQTALRAYSTIMEAELQNVAAYAVRPQAIWDTRRLIEAGDEALGAEAAARLPQDTRADLRSAGRCLAFELPTASGFHVARATETMILALMDAAQCKKGRSNWGAYVAALKDSKADEKVTTHIDRVRDLHRNPLIHPELTLSNSDAVVLWTTCIGLIAAILDEIERLTAKAST